jgi:hypothetical protein
MRRASPERGENSGPARNFVGSLTPNPELENTQGQIRLLTGCSRTCPAASAVRQKADHIRAPALVIKWVPQEPTYIRRGIG